MYKELIFETPEFNEISFKAGKVTKLTVPTVVNCGKDKVDKMVNEVNDNFSVTVVNEPAENEPKLVALFKINEP